MDPLLTARDAVLAQIAELTSAHAEIMAASEGSNVDDEHDPEGATIAFERQQAAALLEQARGTLAAIDAALARQAAGSYGTCTRCGQQIGAVRLAVRPHASHCIGCAA